MLVDITKTIKRILKILENVVIVYQTMNTTQ